MTTQPTRTRSAIRSRRRRLTAMAPLSAVLAAGLLLSGCAEPEPRGSGEVESLDGVSLEVADDGSPQVEVDEEIAATEISSRVLQDGDGEEIDNGDLALVQTAVVDPATGEVQANNFTQGSEAVFVDDQLQESNGVLYDMLDQNQVGAQVAFFMPAAELGQGAQDQLMVFQISGKAPLQATGEPVEVADDSLPEITRDEETGEPIIATPEGEAPEELVVQPLLEGEGETVGANDYVTVQYKGVTWSDGEEFDSSWSRSTPFSFGPNQVIPGWTQGLEGQNVGSQVMLVIPPELAYGDEGTEGIDPGETLVFVIDILHTMPPAQPPAPSEEGAPSEEPEAPEESASPEASPSES